VETFTNDLASHFYSAIIIYVVNALKGIKPFWKRTPWAIKRQVFFLFLYLGKSGDFGFTKQSQWDTRAGFKRKIEG